MFPARALIKPEVLNSEYAYVFFMFAFYSDDDDHITHAYKCIESDAQSYAIRLYAPKIRSLCVVIFVIDDH